MDNENTAVVQGTSSVSTGMKSKKQLRKEEKEAVKHDISVAFSDLMAKMFNDYPSINNKEVLLCILSFLDVNKNLWRLLKRAVT